jgi:ribosomal protein L29
MTYDVTFKYKPDFLREMSIDELNQMLNQAQRKQFELRETCLMTGRRKSPQHIKQHLFKKVKRDIARIKTLLSEIATPLRKR